MKCEDVKRQMDEYLAGSLPAAQATKIEQHLEGCMSCMDLLLPSDPELDALLAADWYAADPSPDFSAKVMASLQPRRSWSRILLMIAAWSGYMAIWLLMAVYWLFPSVFSAVGARFGWVIRAVRAAYVTVSALIETASRFNLTTIGAICLFSFTALIFLTINKIEKEGLA